ncbi:sigma-54-dependent Fis family transcriptional regulator [Leptospira gomenensis]|uniref:Sigma-54-dependent Fis family transcriptional regulator n=1 Tax=Leptospira gomenensis TaxID=2484974 RepID=A0A5F1Z0Y8_9LEPT|nr:sigma 54-interacting transcriptional regulator [Leptospira gomenensis]TGK29016.1 sigma-54-dependent Fis family transcriptional regulator [Leptospira gomenensis]TGK44983.1 sigma-54-dependent Fis family transcriptional regulator [Leptospira gomenensis]TGK51880.1 sigma-54-dependent Fis family transcriptional regulator [Leptospira gomenensis]TGK67312.1 sigma-54-dependent Fis family transcriptional regulator [Leptospira gomenensis]
MLELTIHSVGRLAPTLLCLSIAIHLWLRETKDKSTFWLGCYFSFLFLFNLGYFLGYSVSSEDGIYLWILASAICLASASRLQLSYHFFETVFEKESKRAASIFFVVAVLAIAETFFWFHGGKKWLPSIHTYGPIYFSFSVPVLSLFGYLASLIVGMRKLSAIRKKEGIRAQGWTGLKRIWRENIGFRINFQLTTITFFEVGLNFIFLIGNKFWVANSALAEWMNVALLLVFSSYVLIYSLSPAGRTGFTPRLTGVTLVFCLLLLGIPARAYQEKNLDAFRTQLEAEPSVPLSSYETKIVSATHFVLEESNPNSLPLTTSIERGYRDGRFVFFEFQSVPLFGFARNEGKNTVWKVFPYSRFRKKADEGARFVSFWYLVSVFGCMMILPFLYRTSLILPLRHLKEDIEKFALKEDPNFDGSWKGKREVDSFRFSFKEILSVLEKAKQQMPEVFAEIQNLSEVLTSRVKITELGNRVMIYKSASMFRVLEEAERAKFFKSPVLLIGENGTGKESIARFFHGANNINPFVVVPCASVPSEFWRSEIFGHTKKAFRDALSDRAGRLVEAKEGTLFFDEVGDIPLYFQAELSNLLEENRFSQTGSDSVLTYDCRFIFATRKNLEDEVAKKKFNEDLWNRIRTFTISIPALRERPEDIPYLVRYFLDRYSSEIGRKSPELPFSVLGMLMSDLWPGNIRELENTILRAVVSNSEKTLQISSFPEIAARSRHLPSWKNVPSISSSKRIDLDEEIKKFAKDLVETALRVSGGNKTKAAQYLGIKRTTLTYRIKELGIREEKLLDS